MRRDTAAYAALEEHADGARSHHLRDLFHADAGRLDRMTLRLADIYFDFSKNRLTEETSKLLLALAEERGVAAGIARMFDGEPINTTEGRAVLHVALRNRKNRTIRVDDRNVMPSVVAILAKMRTFVERIADGKHTGHTGEEITDIVNIGIGGSDLGPLMVCEALRPFWKSGMRAHFISNVDGGHLARTLEPLDPAKTLFIVASKSFRTIETLTNATSARAWLVDKLGADAAVAKHFAAVSTNLDAVKAFGIEPTNVFEIWDWVGGRYSLWSAIGLPIACVIGMDRFEELLAGAFRMDEHFRTAALEENIPVIAALIGVWHSRFLGCETYAVLPYEQGLHRFPAWLQQADMESNGKRARLDGSVVEDGHTGPIVWGEPGTNAQHSFFQLLHQGTHIVPCDFLAPLESERELPGHHELLLANMLAQAEALMVGKTEEEVREELEADGLSPQRIEQLVPHKVFPGNRPSTTILFDRLDPTTLGSLLAFYEHRVFVQGLLFGINSFDQWGVELGKQMATRIVGELRGQPAERRPGHERAVHDASTAALIERVRARRSAE